MRDKIRLPADVELSTKFINLPDGHTDEGVAEIFIDSEPNGAFKKVTRITIKLPTLGEVITIVPKERKPT